MLASFFLDCSAATRSRNSFCLASKEDTPSGVPVTSARAGVRERGAVVVKARRRVFWVLRELGVFRKRRANIVMLLVGLRYR